MGRKILVTGANGLVGSTLVPYLQSRGYTVSTLSLTLAVDVSKALQCLEKPDTVLHLCGENIGEGRWTEKKKKRIYDSRVHLTKQFVDHLVALDKCPAVFLCASAVHIYGDCGNESVTEQHTLSNQLFLSKVCSDWERACQGIENISRVINCRFGVICDETRGAFPKMCLPFRWKLGGVMGEGHQYTSVVSIKDVVASILFLIENAEASGPFNIALPENPTALAIAHCLQKHWRQPFLPKIPKKLITSILGQKGAELFFVSINAYPQRLLDLGYRFISPTFTEIVHNLLK